jgi:3-dehydroquinate synthase
LEVVTVELGTRSYDICIGAEILSELSHSCASLKGGSNIGVVTNPVVAGYYLDQIMTVLTEAGFRVYVIEIPDGERYKSLDTLKIIYDRLIEFGFDRHSLLLALGGGVVGDITGFAAATFLRGIPYLQVPTTLLAQVDSSVGGKTGVNHERGKNQIGAFYQPRMVFIDTSTLDTLPIREYLGGLAEIVKYGVVLDSHLFEFLEKNVAALLDRDRSCLEFIIKRSCEIKASVVAEDEREAGLRAVLNFGHTLGHAVETLTGYDKYIHGEAVAIGIVQAAKISEGMGISTLEDTKRICSLIESLGLPSGLPSFSPSEYVDVLLHDKKVKAGGINFVFNRGIGDFQFLRVTDLDPLLRMVGIGG